MISMKTTLLVPNDVYLFISQWSEKSYPHEGCGLLIGQFGADGQKKVVRLAPLSNELLIKTVNNAPTLPQNRQGEGAGKTEFVMSPTEFNQETLKAEREGLDVVGVIHTHPDHPPRPSQIDASQPFLAQWSNVIVSVQKGKTVEMKSWFRERDDEAFVEEEIHITKNI